MFTLLAQAFQSLIFPAFCSYCHSFDIDQQAILCTRCMSLLMPVVTIPLKITDAFTAKVFAASSYQEPLRSLVMAKHYRNRYASRQLGQLLWEKTDLAHTDFDYIIPVPLHWSRYAWRWYNQADQIAKVLSEKSGKPVLHALKRRVRTVYQAGLTKQERKENIVHAFELILSDPVYKHKKFLVVDDVMTTGSTLSYALKTLLPLKPESLLVAVACRVI